MATPITAPRPRLDPRLPLCYSTFETPFGLLFVAYSGDTVRAADLAVSEADFEETCRERVGVRPDRETHPPERLRRAVRAFLDEGERYQGFIDLSPLTEFQQRVLRKTCEIRRGEVRSYHWVAREIGAPGAVRAVGTALARNPIPILVPCHRVVRSDFRIGEYGCGGPAKKREILEIEGVDVAYLEGLGRRGIRFEGSRTTHIYCVPGCYAGRRMKSENRVFFTSSAEAEAAGFRPCKLCRPT